MSKRMTKQQKAISKARAEFDAVVDRSVAIFGEVNRAGLSVALAGGAKAAPMRATVVGERVVFSNGQFGDHSLDLGCSDAERVLSHWTGYLTNNERFGRAA